MNSGFQKMHSMVKDLEEKLNSISNQSKGSQTETVKQCDESFFSETSDLGVSISISSQQSSVRNKNSFSSFAAQNGTRMLPPLYLPTLSHQVNLFSTRILKLGFVKKNPIKFNCLLCSFYHSIIYTQEIKSLI